MKAPRILQLALLPIVIFALTFTVAPRAASSSIARECIDYWHRIVDPETIVLCEAPRACRCYLFRRQHAYMEEHREGIPSAATVPAKIAALLDEPAAVVESLYRFRLYECSLKSDRFRVGIFLLLKTRVPLVVYPEQSSIAIVVEERDRRGEWRHAGHLWSKGSRPECARSPPPFRTNYYFEHEILVRDRPARLRVRFDPAGDHIPLQSDEFALDLDPKTVRSLRRRANEPGPCNPVPRRQVAPPPRVPPRPPPPEVCTWPSGVTRQLNPDAQPSSDKGEGGD